MEQKDDELTIGEPSGDLAVIGDGHGGTQSISMQLLQDVYNEITGMSEELNKGYEQSYQITFDDLIQLNIKINQLYEQYNIKSKNTQITIYYQKDSSEKFSSFERFSLYNRDIVNSCGSKKRYPLQN